MVFAVRAKRGEGAMPSVSNAGRRNAQLRMVAAAGMLEKYRQEGAIEVVRQATC